MKAKKFLYICSLISLGAIFIFVFSRYDQPNDGPPLASCNETTTSVNIKVEWGLMSPAPGSVNCTSSPGTAAYSPLNTAATGTTLSVSHCDKGIVQIYIEPKPGTCALSQRYVQNVFTSTPGKTASITCPIADCIITLRYVEESNNCIDTQHATRVSWLSTTTFPKSAITSGATLTLNTPLFESVANCQ
jgi:hypothetical protein